MGFRVIDEVARRLNATKWRTKDGSRQTHVAQQRVVLAQPLNYMNESGWPLSKIARWWKTPPTELLVVVDDLDLPLGKLRMREQGGSGGHNGLKSIIEYFGEDFPRLRVGIGRSADGAIDHVLSKFSAEEERRVDVLISVAADGVERWLARGPVEAMNFVNAWREAASTQDETAATDKT